MSETMLMGHGENFETDEYFMWELNQFPSCRIHDVMAAFRNVLRISQNWSCDCVVLFELLCEAQAQTKTVCVPASCVL